MLKTALIAALLAGLAVPAFAQTALDQLPNGVVRGLEEQNTSGQVGEVAFRTHDLTVDVKGTGGRAEAVTLNRSFACPAPAGRAFANLGTLSNGRLTATAPLANDRLLSGNYVIVVHNNTPTSRPVSCGQLYR